MQQTSFENRKQKVYRELFAENLQKKEEFIFSTKSFLGFFKETLM